MLYREREREDKGGSLGEIWKPLKTLLSGLHGACNPFGSNNARKQVEMKFFDWLPSTPAPEMLLSVPVNKI